MSTVLIVDENDVTRTAIINELTEHRILTKVTEVVDDAVEIIKAGGIDLVMLEMMLPFRGANEKPDFIPGSRVLDALRGTDIPVILVPSWKVPDLTDINVVSTFPKPFRYMHIVNKIVEILAQTQPA